jgi:hypothetical protein
LVVIELVEKRNELFLGGLDSLLVQEVPHLPLAHLWLRAQYTTSNLQVARSRGKELRCSRYRAVLVFVALFEELLHLCQFSFAQATSLLDKLSDASGAAEPPWTRRN